MSYTSGFFDAIDQGGGEYDRVYSAATFAHYFSLLVKNGVFPDPSTGLQVKALSSPNMQISISPGSGWINGYYITVPDNSPEVLTVPTANPSLSRYDSVIMGLNSVDREIQLYIKSGAVSASPSPVTLQQDSDLYELELARISIGAGTVSITQSLIIDTRSDSTRCGIVAGMIDQIDTTDLFAQYDDAFQAWFSNIQSQLSSDIAANLQNQVNQLKLEKVNVSDKATEDEATAGADDTKWMTPLKVKQVIGTAPDTVLEVSSGERITAFQKGFQRQAIINPLWFYAVSNVLETASPLSIEPWRTTGSASHTMFFDTEADNGGELIVLGTVRSSHSTSTRYHPAWGRISADDAKSKFLPTVSVHDPDGSTDFGYPFFMALSNRCYSADNTVMVTTPTNNGSTSVFILLDVKYNTASTLSEYQNFFAFATESYWGIIYQESYSIRRVYFAPRGTAIPTTYTSLSSGTSSSYYRLKVVGVIGDKIYFIEPTSASAWRLDCLSWVSGTPNMTIGLQTFDFASSPWNQTSTSESIMYPILYDDQYSYVYVEAYSGNTKVSCAHVIKIDMITGTTNWNEVVPEQALPSANVSSTYLGSLPNGKAYYYYVGNGKHFLYTLDKETALLSEEIPWTFDSSDFYACKFFWLREQVFNLDIGSYLWTGNYLFNPELSQWIKPKACLYSNPLMSNSSARVITSRDISVNGDLHSYGVKFIGTEVTGHPPILAADGEINNFIPFIDCRPELVLGPYREED